MQLGAFGYSSFFDEQRLPGDPPTVGRIILEEKGAYRVQTERGVFPAELAGRIYHHAKSKLDMPAVGDFCLLKLRLDEGKAVVQRLLRRKTVLTRADGRDLQILAANVDVALLVTSLNLNFNLRRLERYLTLARESGVQPVIVLSKLDLVDSVDEALAEVQAVAADAPIHAVSCLTETGLDSLRPYLSAGQTGVVLGSSGVGKSTLVNHLAGADIEPMMEARDLDDKGRHCTTHRHLIPLPGGGMIIDTPGLRGLTLTEAEAGLAATFGDLEALTVRCKFTDCQHDTEPGCAIRAAVESGQVDGERVANYLKLQAESRAEAERLERLAEKKARKLAKRQRREDDER